MQRQSRRGVDSGEGHRNTPTPTLGSKGGAAGPATTAPPSAPPPQPPGYTPVPPNGPEEPRRPRGAVAGLVLIVIGAIALAGQFLPGLAWWSLWPLIIVFAGLVQAFTPGHEGWTVNRMFDGFVTVAIGLVILAISTGYVGFGVVWDILSLWPVLIIAIGIDLLGKALHMSWIRALGSILVIAALAWAVAMNASGAGGIDTSGTTSGGQTARLSEPVGGVTEGELTIDAGAANVSIEGGQQLVEARASSPWGTPSLSVERSGDQANVDLTMGEANGVILWPGTHEARLDAKIARSVLWDVNLNVGVTSLDADLADVPVRSIDVKPGVADCTVRLGEVPSGVDEAAATVKSGISSVKVEIPSGVEARVESDSGLTGHTIDSELHSVGSGVWETDGFQNARQAGRGVWVISIKSGLGSVNVSTY